MLAVITWRLIRLTVWKAYSQNDGLGIILKK
jgi:hypothetical protein